MLTKSVRVSAVTIVDVAVVPKWTKQLSLLGNVNTKETHPMWNCPFQMLWERTDIICWALWWEMDVSEPIVGTKLSQSGQNCSTWEVTLSSVDQQCLHKCACPTSNCRFQLLWEWTQIICWALWWVVDVSEPMIAGLKLSQSDPKLVNVGSDSKLCWLTMPAWTHPCWSEFILLGRKAIKTQMLERIGWTTIRKPTLIPTNWRTCEN